MFRYLSYDDTVKMDLHMRDDVPMFEEARLEVATVKCSSCDEAVEGADIVLMAASTRVPVTDGAAVGPGCTVISNTPEELDEATVRKASRIVVTSTDEVARHVPPWQAVDAPDT